MLRSFSQVWKLLTDGPKDQHYNWSATSSGESNITDWCKM